jgi:acyl transferase domain-containing protein
MDDNRDIAIVGMSALLPQARDVDEYWRNVVNGVDAITEVGPDRWPGVRSEGTIPIGGLELARRGGFVPTPIAFEAFEHKVVPSAAKSPAFDQFVLIDLVADALADAGISADDPVRESTDLIVGRGGYPTAGIVQAMAVSEGNEWFARYLAANIEGVSASDIESIVADITRRLGDPNGEAIEASVPNFAASRAANRLDLKGVAYTLDAACASSLIAVEHAVDRLRAGRADVGVAAGVNFFQFPAFWWMLRMVGAVSPTGNSRPFDAAADGIVLSEGAGVVVLKRLGDAVRDGNEVYAVIKGVGSSSDGSAKGLLAPSPAGQRLALERAYRDAGVDPDSIGMVETHGTGTRIGDAAELATLREVFGPRRHRYATRPIASVKSMIGHTIPASGLASLIKMALALRDQVQPPSLNVEEPLDAITDVDFFLNTELRPWVNDPASGPRRGAVDAFGFGGVNSHVILEEAGGAHGSAPAGSRRVVPRPTVSVVDRPTELIVATAPSRQKLAEPLRQVLALVLEESDADLEFVAYHLSRLAEPTLPWRLVGVVGSDSTPEDLLRSLADRIDRGDEVDDLGVSIVESDVADGSIVALFGGAAPGMIDDAPAQQLAKYLHFTSAREAFDLAEPGTGHDEDPLPVSFQLDPPAEVSREDRREMALRFQPVGTDGDGTPPPHRWPLLGPVIPAVQYASWCVARDLNLDVSSVLAISNGEPTALIAAGVVDYAPLLSAIRNLYVTDFYTSYDWSSVSGGFAYASEQALAPHLERHPEVEITVHVDEEMQFLGGPVAEMRAFAEELRADGLMIAEMQLGGIHSRHVRPVTDRLVVDAAASLVPRDPQIPIVVATGADLSRVEGSVALRHVSESMSRPLRLWQALQAMVDEGVRDIVELGPTTQRVQFRKRLEGVGGGLVLASEESGVHPVTQLQRMVAEMVVAGKRVDPAGLLVGRLPRGLATRPTRSDRALHLTTVWQPFGDPEADPGRWRDHRAGGGERTPARPFVGATSVGPDGVFTNRLRLDLDTDRHVVDHAFVSNDGRPVEQRFPVVALTVLVEMMAETALELSGADAVVEVRDVRVTRWVSLADRRDRDIVVEARAGAETVDATLRVDGVVHATAGFVVGAERPARAEAMLRVDHTDPAVVPLAPSRIYGENHFFHGEAFRCLASVDVASGAGVTGTLVTRPPGELFSWAESPGLALDPVVLDGVGQLLATWFLGSELKTLPTMIERIEIHGPTPPPWTVLDARTVPTAIDHDAHFAVFDAEVGDGAGGVWLRVVGFRDWLFSEDPRLTGYRLAPSTHVGSDPVELPGLPDVTVRVLPRFALNDLQMAIVRLLILHPDEQREVDGIESRRRRVDYMIGRIALKDACRIVAGLPTYPHGISAQVVEGVGMSVLMPHGRPRMSGSVTHGPAGAAAALSARRVGIDLEAVAAVAAVEAASFCTSDEEALGSEITDPAAWRCALWVAKEASAKLAGSGLGGRPLRWRATAVAPDLGVVAMTDTDTDQVAQVHLEWFEGAVLGVAVEVQRQ